MPIQTNYALPRALTPEERSALEAVERLLVKLHSSDRNDADDASATREGTVSAGGDCCGSDCDCRANQAWSFVYDLLHHGVGKCGTCGQEVKP